jgi:hypothetical protein
MRGRRLRFDVFGNSVTIVASPRPRGKIAMLSPIYLQEAAARSRLDLNAGEGTLAQFLPGHVTRSAIDDLKGQMALFDRLIADDGAQKVVDLGRTSFEPFFKLASQFGFAEEARSRGIAPAVLYVMTPDGTSFEAYRRLRSRLPEAELAPVHNEIFGARNIGMLRADGQRYGCRGFHYWRRTCANTSRGHRSRSQIPSVPPPIWISISSCNTGCGGFIVSSGNSMRALY